MARAIDYNRWREEVVHWDEEEQCRKYGKPLAGSSLALETLDGAMDMRSPLRAIQVCEKCGKPYVPPNGRWRKNICQTCR